MTIKKGINYIIAILVTIYLLLLSPIYYELKFIVNKFKSKRNFKYYKFYHTHGGFIVTRDFRKESIENIYMIFVVPDKNIWTMYYRLWRIGCQFVVEMSFNEYIKTNKLNLLKLYSTKNNYKTGKLEFNKLRVKLK